MILTPLIDALQRADTLNEQADTILNSALRSRGWQFTCQTPGSCWLWRKHRSDGVVYLVTRDIAIDMERDL